MEEVKALLDEWHLSHLYEVFVENSIDYEAFCALNNDHIKELIPKVGDRIKFTSRYSKLKQGQSSISFDIDAASTSSGSAISICEELKDFVDNTPLENVPVPYKSQNAFCIDKDDQLANYKPKEPLTYDFDLKSFLESSSEGREILHSSGNFTPRIRSRLAEIIISNELKNDESAPITTVRFIQLARLIKQLFPTENISTYYTPYTVVEGNAKYKRSARGKLFDKYHNRRRILRSVGLINKKAEEAKTENTNDTEENLEAVRWLENCFEPWSDVTEKWGLTYDDRKRMLGRNIEVGDYFEKFPALKQPLGYTLIENDFKKTFLNIESRLFVKLPELQMKIIAKIRQSKEVHLQRLSQQNEHLESEDQEVALALIGLPYLFAKTCLIKPTTTKTKIQWRPSKIEVQEAFIAHLTAAAEIRPFLERRQKKYLHLKQTCQPVILIIGENLKKYEVLISINSLIYKAGNLLKTVDVTFKMFHVLNLKYPVECEYVWYFIQKYVYEMETPWDKPHVLVEQLISDLVQK